MPSKKYNGNSPLDGTRLDGFADAELEIARRSPKQSLTAGLVQTPSGAIHAPKRRRRRSSAATTTHPWKVTVSQAEDETYFATVLRSYFVNPSDGGVLQNNPFSTSLIDEIEELSVIYLEGTVTAFSPVPKYATLVDYNDLPATTRTYPLAYIGNDYAVVQNVTGNLGYITACVNGEEGVILAGM